MKKILSVDDSKAVHAFLDSCLKEKYEMSHVFDGQEAIDLLLKEDTAVFDLILLDWEMPRVTGPEVVKALREANVQTPIIMLTSKNSVEDITMMLDLGVNDYMMKPFTPDLIQDKVQTVLGEG